MSYYNSNAIYDHLGHTPHYCWTVGNAWILVYGDHNSDPKLIVFAHGKSWLEDKRVLAVVAGLFPRGKHPPGGVWVGGQGGWSLRGGTHFVSRNPPEN